ncbi:hypothetical protein PENSPDRAFT_316400 [Peniophora sp. CONT]|nr:hypothetical protein PENSPDRAFT_316400 [Peniophora sp. CONT]
MSGHRSTDHALWHQPTSSLKRFPRPRIIWSAVVGINLTSAVFVSALLSLEPRIVDAHTGRLPESRMVYSGHTTCCKLE